MREGGVSTIVSGGAGQQSDIRRRLTVLLSRRGGGPPLSVEGMGRRKRIVWSAELRVCGRRRRAFGQFIWADFGRRGLRIVFVLVCVKGLRTWGVCRRLGRFRAHGVGSLKVLEEVGGEWRRKSKISFLIVNCSFCPASELRNDAQIRKIKK